MRLRAPRGGCTVRMYRHGLGDCFLLAFGANNGQQRYVLIDCGVLLGTPEGKSRMQRVAESIKEATNSHLHALVVTHEHWDHVSGFVQAREAFEGIRADSLWLAWTEDPENALAQELRARRQAALQALNISLTRLRAAGSPYAERIASVTGFFGPNLGANGRPTTEDALNWVKAQWPDHRYCAPGSPPLKLSGLPDVRFYVLGPPADWKFLRKSRPSTHHSEVYLDDNVLQGMAPFLAGLGLRPAASGHADAFGDPVAPGTPFNRIYALDPDDGAVARLYPDVAEIQQRYAKEDWRAIDDNWLEMAGELALKLDAHTNNTSLVLAIELGTGGKVLLFPGDAQVGNWLSWQGQTWGEGEARLTASDLLARTVLYKVGHHGSHNATLREKGLEQMTDPHLTAVIPVDTETARKQRWQMPYAPLHERLLELTEGRVILSDAGLPAAAPGNRPSRLRSQVSQKDLYVDVTIMP